MVKILAIHNTDDRNRDFFTKMKKRYTFLAKKDDNKSIVYKVTIIKLGTKLADIPRSGFDRIWFHKDTVKVSDITEYVVHAGSPQVLDFRTEEKEEKDGKKKGNKPTKEVKVRRLQGRRKTRQAQDK